MHSSIWILGLWEANEKQNKYAQDGKTTKDNFKHVPV